MARIKIDVSAGILEVEGDEAFLREIYEDFKNRVKIESSTPPAKSLTAAKKDDDSKEKTIKAKTKPSARKESYSFVKDLNLRGDGESVESLGTFYGKKQPSSALEKTTVFVYYLDKLANVERITVDHIYTCYKEVGAKVPTALKQNLLDTAHRKGTIDTSSLDAISLTTRGENMVELDLPASPKASD